MNEKRTAQRVAIEVDVELRVTDAWERARTRNLSLGGLYVVTGRPLEVGTKLRVRLAQASLEAGAVVRWVEDGGAGLQFDGLRARDVYALGKFLEGR